MESWLGQYCIYVSDLDATVKFYETLGLTCTSRTDLGTVKEAVLENPHKGGKIQLAHNTENTAPIDMGNAFWKLYVATNDIAKLYKDAMDAGYKSISEPQRGPQWPMTIGFIADPDGYQVELTQRHPWKDGDDTTYVWLNQYCIYVSDIVATTKFYETLGLKKTSEIDLGPIKECILEHESESKGGKVQLAQKLSEGSPITMGTSMWKLYVNTDDCRSLYKQAIEAGYTSVMEPMEPGRWPVTLAFIQDPDGYQIELVERHPDPE